MRKIFRYMMENGYYPTYGDNYILFDIDSNTSVLEYEDGVLTVRTFFSIDEECYDMFLEASNHTMIRSFMIKPAVVEDMQSIMFSCETLCMNMSDFKRFLPKMRDKIRQGVDIHKNEMRKLIKATEMMSRKKPVMDEMIVQTGKSPGKPLS